MANYEDVESQGGALHFLRDELNCENLGISVIDAEAGWEGKEHNHDSDNQEEVYLLVEGEATIYVDDEERQLQEGDAIRVPADQDRRIVNGDSRSKIIAVSAP